MGSESNPLLERDFELESLQAALKAAGAGSGRVMLVSGPAGIGKSRLLAAAGERAEPAGMLILRARGGELERDFPFGVARQLFEPALAELDPSARAAVLDGAAALAAPVVGLAEDVGGPVAGDRLFAAMHGLYWLCVNLAARQPLMFEVDDAHWADEQSLLWLAYLARRIGDIPALLVLGVRRDEASEASAPLAAIAAESLTRTLEPRPLGVSAAASLVAGVVGVEPAPEVARACHDRSAGNPFVLHELALALTESGVAPDQPGAVESVAAALPDTVARSVLRRLTSLSEPAVALARAVAVLGPDAQLLDAARLADLGEGTAADAMDALTAAGLLLPRTPLRFAHPLIGEAIYSDLPTGRRLSAHRRAADVLTARISPESIGAHLLQCEPRGDAHSVAVLRRCGARAVERGAPQTAVRYLARALEEQPAPEVRGALLRELGAAEARVGRAEAVEHLEEALTLARGTDEIAANSRELAIALGALGRLPDAVAAFERGIELLDGRDRELSLRLEGELGAMGQLAVQSTQPASERLRRLAPGLAGETPGERLILASYAHVRSNELAPVEELTDLATRALGDGLLLQEHTAESPVFALLMYVFFRADRYDVSEHWLAEALTDERARGSLLGTSVALAVRSQMRWLRGELLDAEADAHTSMDAQVEAGWAAVLPLAVAILGECLVERGDPEAAAKLFEDNGLGGPLPELQLYRWAQAARGRARIAAGRIDEGIADLLDCPREQMGARASIALEWRTTAALGLAARGDVAQARALAGEQLALTRGQPGVARPHGVALRVLGMLSEGDEAQRLLSEAVTVLEGSSARLEHARALVELGASMRRAGKRAAAREHLRAGYEIARSCGSLALVDQAGQELAASGVRLRREALAGRDALTPSERRVAEMAATGMSNPQIAQALFVTRKTIEMHLGHVYKKLGVTGREQVAQALTAAEPQDAEVVAPA